MIITRTPLRVSLVGGGTDMPSYYSKAPGAVFSFSINKYIYVTMNPKFDGRFRISYSHLEIVNSRDEIKHDLIRSTLEFAKQEKGLEVTTVADIPGNGTGLGSSSSLTVGMLKALFPDSDPGILAEQAFLIETEFCGSPVGKQDQYAAAFGGMNYITFGKNRVSVRPVTPSLDWLTYFQDCCLLLWTGFSRDANTILKDQKKNFDNGAGIEHGRKLSELAHRFMDEVSDKGSVKRLGEIMDEAWHHKCKLSGGVTNEGIDKLYKAGMNAGAYGGKLLGAGGGGFLFFIAPQYHHKAIVEATGLRKIDFRIEEKGSEIIYE